MAGALLAGTAAAATLVLVHGPSQVSPSERARAGAAARALAPEQLPPSTTYGLPAGATVLATVKKTIARYAGPAGAPMGTIEPTWHGAELTTPVIAEHGAFLEIRLPQRPNETTAWVRKSTVALSWTAYRIVVDERTTKLTLEEDGRAIDTFPAGIGSPVDPTPTGTYFVAYLAKPPSSGYGPFVIVTSAHSDVIADWNNSGDAEIAIHGPLGADTAIGTDGARVSHGCIRLHVVDLDVLRRVPIGTPVDIESD